MATVALMTIPDQLDAMTGALEPIGLEIPGLQVTRYFNNNPSPPSIDIYPADPFQAGAGFGIGNVKLFWTVRARAFLADPQAASDTLYRLLDVNDPASVEAALAGVEAVVGNDGTVSGLIRWADDPTGDMIGVQWRIGMWT